jgi:phospholipase/carboxylesterase
VSRTKLTVAFVLVFAACTSRPADRTATERRRPSVAASPARPASATPAPARSSPPASETASAFAYVEVTTGGADKNAPLPLVIALHGLGDRPEHFVALFDGFRVPARVVAPHSATSYGDGYSWFPFRVGDPDASAPGIAAAADALAPFIEAVARERPTLGRPIVTGFSQGGALSYALAVRHPEAVAAAFPAGGWISASLVPPRKPASAPPILAVHGTADPLVPIERARASAARLAAVGFSIDLREFEGVGHGIPGPVRDTLFAALGEACERERARGPR